MNKAFVLHYYEDDTEYKMYSTNMSVLLNKIKEWEAEDMSTHFDRITELHYENVEDLLQNFNSINGTQ